jgi:ribosomal protein L29
MKYQELTKKTGEDLTSLLLETKKALYNLRFQNFRGEAVKGSEVRKSKKLVAKILTALNSKGTN